MKTYSYLLILSFVIGCGGFASIAEANTIVRTGETISVMEDQKVDGNFYALGSLVSLAGEITGDVVAAAGTVSINAPVEHDVLVVAGTVSINAPVKEDVRIVAGDVTIANDVIGSVFIVGGRVTILSTAKIKGDVLLVAGEAVVEGKVEGQILGVIERLRVNSEVASIDVDVNSLTIGDRANISGDVRYTSAAELVRAPQSVIGGEVVRNDVSDKAEPALPYRQLAMTFLVSLFASLSLYLVARRPLTLYAVETTRNVAKEAFVGFGLLVAVPVAIIILMISVLGLFLGLIGLATFLLVVILALPLINVLVGTLLSRLFQNKPTVNILSITLGAITAQILWLIPIIGPILLLIVFFMAIGGLATSAYRLLRSV